MTGVFSAAPGGGRGPGQSPVVLTSRVSEASQDQGAPLCGPSPSVGSQTPRPWACTALLLLGASAPPTLSRVPSHGEGRSAQLGQHGRF